MKHIIPALLIIILVLTTMTRETTHSIKKLVPNDTILAFGDSITYGYGVNPDESYPSVLSQLSGHPVVNAGISGETSAQGLHRLPTALKGSNAKLMILCFGGNDIIQGKSRESLRENLVAMIKMAKNNEMQVLLIAVPDITLVGLSTLSLYEEIAEEEEIPLLDSLLENVLGNDSLKSDHIHPNARGYRQIAEEIYQAMKKYQML